MCLTYIVRVPKVRVDVCALQTLGETFPGFDPMATSNPFKQIVAVKKHEWPLALSLSLYFFLVITTFWILKPIKKSLLVGFYQQQNLDLFGWMLSGSEAEQLAKVMNMVVAAAAVAVFSLLSDRLQRERLTAFWAVFMAVCLVTFSGLIGTPSEPTVWAFYLFGDLFNTVMVASFFAFANDAIPPEAAKRLYGIIGLGGVAGGAFGTTTLRATLGLIDRSGWLLISAGVMALIVGVAFVAARYAEPAAEKRPPMAAKPETKDAGALASARLVFRSRYLLGLVALVAVYELVSTILDFQFTATVEHFSSLGVLDLDEAFSSLYAFTNVTALLVQLLLTSFVMQRFGVGVALLVLPGAALLGSVGFVLVPIYFTGAALSASDNAFNYSINQSARETLYTVTSREEKYKAKAFIDMFVQRTAKSLGVGVNLVMAASIASFAGVRYLSLVTIPLLVVWIFVVRYLSRSFDEREAAMADREAKAA
ncbi:MAG: Npt1/Npt2 family nucleotide transporter [Myxococcota bacterium]